MKGVAIKRARLVKPAVAIALLLLTIACSKPDRAKLEPKVEHYRPVQRKFAPEPVYSRVTWSHLPSPIPTKHTEEAPLIHPEIAFDLPNSTLSEATEALAQAMGYRWVYPSDLKDRAVSIRMEGTVEQILEEILMQADVLAEIDTRERVIRIYTKTMQPQLPAMQ